MKLFAWLAPLLVVAAPPLSAQSGPPLAETPAATLDDPEAAAATPNESAADGVEGRATTAADLAPAEVAEVPPLIPTGNFASRSAFRGFRMSPDGSQLLIERNIDNRDEILLIDTATKTATKRLRMDEGQRIDWLRWAGNAKLLMSISYAGTYFGLPIRLNRLFVRELDTDDMYMLEVDSRVIWGGDLVHLADDGSFALISVQKNYRSYPSVYRYELRRDAEPVRVVKPKTGVWDWHADDDGVVRLGMGWRNKRLRVYYRSDGQGKFDLIGKLKLDDDRSRFWNVVQIVSNSDQGYVLEEGENGRVGVRLFDYASGQSVETYYEHPDWDVEELWLDDGGSPLAAIYTDDREQIVWFDKEQGELYENIRKALKLEDVRVVTRSRGREKSLVWAGSEADPGALFLFSPEKKTLDVFANYRPDLDFQHLVKPAPFTYTSRDGLEIAAYLTLPRGREPRGLPLIIFPHGGPYGVRDELQYDDTVQFLANRGYAVLQPNFRGSSGYGDAFFEAGHGEIGRKMQDDLDDAMDWAVEEGIADPGRVCVVGGSYGGYAALWAVLRNPERYRCAASWAGVTDLDRILKYDRGFLSRKASKRWRRQVEGDEDFDLDSVSPAIHAPNLARPVLLAHGTRDGTVPFSQYERFEKAAREAPIPPTTLVIEGEGHGFSKPANEQAWYDALDSFLKQHNPSDVAHLMGQGSEDE